MSIVLHQYVYVHDLIMKWNVATTAIVFLIGKVPDESYCTADTLIVIVTTLQSTVMIVFILF